MRIRHLVAVLLLAVCSLPVRADSIDDAEAKKRGVPVAQVQAENALAKEKQKTAELEKQLAELKDKLSELKDGRAASSPSPAPRTNSTPSPAPKTNATATVPAVARSGPVDFIPPWESLNFDGPRAASKSYDNFVKRYLAGDWATLAADLDKAKNDIAAMPDGNRADLKYVQLTITECRPDWWSKVKQGKPVQFKQSVFGQMGIVDYEPGDDRGFVDFITKDKVVSSRIKWDAEEMDSIDGLPPGFTGLNLTSRNGEPFKEIPSNFVLGDAINNVIWRLVSSASVDQNSIKYGKITNAAESDQYQRYIDFRGELAAAYYCKPAARRMAVVQATSGLDREAVGRAPYAPFRPLAAALFAEWKQQPENYPKLGFGNIATNFDMTNLGNNGEYRGASLILLFNILTEDFTLAEDRRVREVARRIALSNDDWRISKIKLPYDLSVELDPAKDTDSYKARMGFLQAKPATKPK